MFAKVGAARTCVHILAHLFFCQVLLSLAIDLKNNERFTIQCTLKFLRIWMHENCWQQQYHIWSSSMNLAWFFFFFSSCNVVVVVVVVEISGCSTLLRKGRRSTYANVASSTPRQHFQRNFFSFFFREFQRKLQSIVIQEHPVLV